MVMARESREDRGGVLREAREPHADRGSLLNYYDDLGFSSTEEGAESIRADEESFQSEVGEKRGILEEQESSINTAQSKLNSSYSSNLKTLNKQLADIGTPTEMVNEAWSSTPKIGVRVLNSNSQIEQTYYLPKDYVKELDSKLGSTGYAKAWVDNGKNYNIVAWGGATSPGGSLHESLNSAASSYKSQFKTQAYKDAEKVHSAAQSQYNTALSSLNSSKAESQGTIDTAWGEYNEGKTYVDTAVGSREAEWTMLRDDYQNKLQTMRDIFGAISVEEGGK